MSRAGRSGTSRAAGARRASAAKRREDLPGRALARAHGAVHVAQPVVGGLGPGEVDLADRAAQPRPVLASARPGPRGRRGSRASSAPWSSPARSSRRRGSAPGRRRRRRSSRGPARGAGRPAAAHQRACAEPPTKPKSTPTEPSGGRVVEGLRRRADVADPLTAEARVAPERAVVDRLGLGQAARDERARAASPCPWAARASRPAAWRAPAARRGSTGAPAPSPPATTRTPSPSCATDAHRAPRGRRACRGRSATFSLMSCEPPTKRLSCAPPPVVMSRRNEPGWRRVAGRGAVLQDVEQRQLLGVRAPDPLARGGEDRPALLAGDLGAHPLVERHAGPSSWALGASTGR